MLPYWHLHVISHSHDYHVCVHQEFSVQKLCVLFTIIFTCNSVKRTCCVANCSPIPLLLLNFHMAFLSGRTHCRIRRDTPNLHSHRLVPGTAYQGQIFHYFLSQYFHIFRVHLALSSSDQTGFPIILSEFQSRTPWEETENVSDCKV